jgi:hypothetical protein
VTTVLQASRRAVMFDNVPNGKKIGDAVIDTLLTKTEWSDRALGSNELVEYPALAAWSANGNNIGVKADTARRVYPCRLEPDDDRPEERTDFKHADIRKFVEKNRAELLTAAFTIIRGWIAAGAPECGVPALGSYEGWSSVRRAVIYAGAADPLGGMEEFREMSDEKRETLHAIITGFEAIWPGVEVSSSVVAQRFSDPCPDATNPIASLLRAKLNRGQVSPQFVGNLFGEFKGAWLDGKSIQAKTIEGTKKWYIKRRDEKKALPEN